MSSIQATPATGETLSPNDLLQLLYYMRLQRAVEDRGIKLYYQGRIPGAYFTGWGHEAIAVGATYALGPQDLLAPMHRDLAAYIMRGIPVRRVFAQFLDREGGLTRGRDGNIHMGDPRLGIFPFISHMAASVPVAAGMALACRQRGEARVVLTFFGDGATSTGAWHEGVNFAAVFRLPVVLVLENNQYAYSTPLDRQTAARAFVDKASGYGLPGVAVDGNDVVGATSAALIKAVQHLFLIAPALLLPLGAVLLSTRVLPRVFAYLALALGATLQVLGLLGLFSILQPVIDALLMVQALWFVTAALVLLVRAGNTSTDLVG